jgi:hypothetical protein
MSNGLLALTMRICFLLELDRISQRVLIQNKIRYRCLRINASFWAPNYRDLTPVKLQYLNSNFCRLTMAWAACWLEREEAYITTLP